jgi:hypothetical protein
MVAVKKFVIKPLVISKTVWLNIIMVALGALPLVGAYMKIIVPQTALIVDSTVILIAGILNLVLRIFFTAQPITQFAATQNNIKISQ